MNDNRIPVSIITGFLGSGKTTVLNRLLGDNRLRDTAVIVNEFGEIGLDHLLVESAIDQMVLMDNGCLCCSIRGDLVNTLNDLLHRVDDGSIPAFRRIMIETTGLADPAPVVQTLITDESTAERFQLHAIITVVDGINAAETLAEYEEARCQVAMADCILISKTDIAQADSRSIRVAVHKLNPRAGIFETGGTSIDPDFFFSIDTLQALTDQSEQLQQANHEHGHDDLPTGTPAHGAHTWNIQSASIVIEDSLPWQVVQRWLEWLTAMRGPDVLRIKGLLRIDGFSGPVLIQGVQHAFHPPQELAQWPDNDRRSRIVVIARDIPQLALHESLNMFKTQDCDAA